MFSRVVVPLDGSGLAEGVLPHVAEAIGDRASQVYLLSVAPLARGAALPVASVSAPAANTREDRAQIEQELMAYLRSVGERLGLVAADVQVGVRFGRPADDILAFSTEVDADLIAMSTHGRSGIGRWVFGGVAERVLRGAACPVLLVRAGQAQLCSSYQSIMVPLDCSEPAEQILPYVKALIRPGRTQVTLISVLTAGLGDRTVALLTSYPPGLQVSAPAFDVVEVEVQRYLRSVAAVLRDHGAAVHVAMRRGSPADEILAHAAGVGIDLICMTTHGLSGVSRWVYGNVAGKILQGAQCPVLVVRPDAESGRSEA